MSAAIIAAATAGTLLACLPCWVVARPDRATRAVAAWCAGRARLCADVAGTWVGLVLAVPVAHQVADAARMRADAELASGRVARERQAARAEQRARLGSRPARVARDARARRVVVAR